MRRIAGASLVLVEESLSDSTVTLMTGCEEKHLVSSCETPRVVRGDLPHGYGEMRQYHFDL